MYLSSFLTLLTLAASGICRATEPASTLLARAASSGPITGKTIGLQYAFSVTVSKIDPFPLVNSNITGGQRIIEPFLNNGTVSGPLFNGTVLGGQELGYFEQNKTTFIPDVNVYGTTSDGYPFISAVTAGVGGTQTELFAQLTLTANGPYSYLQDLFFLAVLTDKGHTSYIDAYLVNTTTSS